jgi:DNA-binding NtrC family response regulator
MSNARRVLVVDDEPIVNESCRRVLGEEGYDVDTTESGQEGLQRACARAYDLVITDLKMPDLDGMDLIRALRERRPATPVLVITGYASVMSAVRAVRLGVCDYIEKPFTPMRLTKAVHEALAAEKGAEKEEPRVAIDAELVKEVLRRASRDRDFGSDLLTQGSRVLSGLALSPEAKAAILSGDIAWIEARCGDLSPEERDWLERRLQAEIW